MFLELQHRNIQNPVVIICDSYWQTADEHLIHYATECGALLLDGFGDGICLGMTSDAYNNSAMTNASGRNYSSNTTVEQLLIQQHLVFCRLHVPEFLKRNIYLVHHVGVRFLNCRKQLQKYGLLPITLKA
jgi:hypothetical protein